MRGTDHLPGSVTSSWHPALLLPLTGVLAVVGLMFRPVQAGFCPAESALPVVAGVLAVVGMLCLLARRRQFRLTAIDALAGAWLLYVLLRGWCTPEVPCLPAVLRAVSLAALYAALRLLFACAAPPSLMVEGTLAGFALVEGLICVWQLLSGGSHHADFPFTGTFLNPGPCSAVLLMGVCLGMYRFFFPISSQHARLSRLHSALCLSAMVLCLLLLPLGWSRAALLSALCCLAVMTWRRMTSRMHLLLAVGLLVAGGVLYLLKRGSADGRVLFYAVSSMSVAAHPILGSGMGSFFHAYAQETALLHARLPEALVRHAGTIEYALSDGVRVAVEQGAVGLVLTILLVSIVLYRLRRRSEALALVLLGLLVFSLFSYPFQLLPFQLLLVLLASSAATSPGAKSHDGVAAARARGIMGASLVCLFAVTSAFLAYDPVAERVQATRQSRLIMGHDSPRMLGQYQRLYPLMRHDAQFLFRYGQLLASCGRYNESNHVLAQGALVSNDAMFHVLRGHNYRHLQAPCEAARAYRQAHGQTPARLYPLLCLMRLYRQAGQRAPAVRVARMLLHMPQAGGSPLDREIRDEAKNCLGEQ